MRTCNKRLRDPHLVDQLRPCGRICALRSRAQRSAADCLARQKDQRTLKQQQANVHDAQHLAPDVAYNKRIDGERDETAEDLWCSG